MLAGTALLAGSLLVFHALSRPTPMAPVGPAPAPPPAPPRPRPAPARVIAVAALARRTVDQAAVSTLTMASLGAIAEAICEVGNQIEEEVAARPRDGCAAPPS